MLKKDGSHCLGQCLWILNGLRLDEYPSFLRNVNQWMNVWTQDTTNIQFQYYIWNISGRYREVESTCIGSSKLFVCVFMFEISFSFPIVRSRALIIRDQCSTKGQSNPSSYPQGWLHHDSIVPFVQKTDCTLYGGSEDWNTMLETVQPDPTGVHAEIWGPLLLSGDEEQNSLGWKSFHWGRISLPKSMRLRVPGYNLQSLKPEQRKGIGTHCLSNYRPLITLLVIIVCYYIEFPKRFLSLHIWPVRRENNNTK